MVSFQGFSRKINRGSIDFVIFFFFIFFATMPILYFTFIPMYFKAMQAQVWIGVEAVELTPDIKKQFNIASVSGVLVSRVFADSPAQQAGILDGDVIRRWNGISITSLEEFQRLIQTSQDNEQVKLTVDRQGNPVLVYINVGIRP